MMTLIRRFAASAVIAVLLVFSIGIGMAHAGAASGAGAGPQLVVADIPGLVQKVHGCHPFPRIGPVTGILHRHVGPGCRWVEAGGGYGNPCRRWRRRCGERCFDAPRPQRCWRRCYDRNAPDFCF